MASLKTTPTGVHAVIKPKAASAVPLDDSYTNQVAGLNQQLASYTANYGVNRSRVGENRVLTRQGLDINKTNDLHDLLAGFAGRGMINSSSYGYDLGDTNRQYQRRYGDIDRSTTQQTADLDRQLADFRATVSNSKATARSDAIARRAAQYGTL